MKPRPRFSRRPSRRPRWKGCAGLRADRHPGKTAAFALPIIQQLAKKPTRFGQSRAIRALILTPTRELAQQIYDNFVLYGKKLPSTRLSSSAA